MLLASAADIDTAVASAVEAQKEWAWNPQAGPGADEVRRPRQQRR